ncbi:hypothetical protein [Paenibacillus sp. NEAU-GSW1]|uniref:hypothetical protein n=1 Tax=Paenibacillus sp. NEAU-GSW1 TaxID=2682486 RepID=UPI001566458B|nr:hypothetical protein [Paenibacillus sp. NEAU-GSW1]
MSGDAKTVARDDYRIACAKPRVGRPLNRSRKVDARNMRIFIAYLIGSALLLGMIAWIGNATRTEVLLAAVKWWSIITVIDFAYSFSFTLWPRKAKRDSSPD